jgi:hypothetical protein
MDVQNKTKLETNLQAAGVLPSQNTFEARTLRVVVSIGDTDGAGTARDVSADEFVTWLAYNSVTSLFVGEKIMIEMPTFFFPPGAGVVNGAGMAAGHGLPTPEATFRFAEPVAIEPQQNFRVEMAFPQGVPTAPRNMQEVPGPLRIWVVLDGYLTRDVQ